MGQWQYPAGCGVPAAAPTPDLDPSAAATAAADDGAVDDRRRGWQRQRHPRPALLIDARKIWGSLFKGGS